MKVCYIGPDTRIDISDDVSIEVIWPVEISDEPIAADDPNEHNTVYMINYKEIKIMVTGDLLEEDEQEMIEYYQGTETLECDILNPINGYRYSNAVKYTHSRGRSLQK